MTGNSPKRRVRMAFEESTVRVAIADILSLRVVRPELKSTRKYAQIATSIRELGIIEPPVVARQRGGDGKYLLLDGHLRIDALKDMGETEVVCLLSTDDEAVTYNKRVSRIAIVQEHRMIMKAIERGVPEQRIAAALDVDIASLRGKVRLFNGICPEVIDMLKDKEIHMNAVSILKRMLPLRQIEAVELMLAMNKFTASYAQSLLAATPQAELVEPSKGKRIKGLTEKQMLLMQRESAKLDRQFKLIEQTYGNDHLDLVLVNGYVAKLLGNARIVKFLTQHYAEILTEFQKIVDVKSAAA